MRKLLGALGFYFLFVGAATAQAALPVKIGVLTDQSSVYADLTGAGSVLAARMAVEDFGPTVLDRPIQIVVADHQNKPDVGNVVARRWFDVDGVDAVVDLPNSAVALSVLTVAKEKNKAVLFSGAVSSDLTGKYCSAVSTQWAYDTYALSNTITQSMLRQGYKNWYYLMVDANAGTAFYNDSSRILEAGGGKVLGISKHPLNNPDFSSQILQAQASKAQVLAIANAGGDTVNAIKAAAQFGLQKSGIKIAGLLLQLNDVHSIGLRDTQGVVTAESFYWDLDDSSRAFARRFMARHKGTPPNQIQAAVYSSVFHYLKAVRAAGNTGGEAVTSKMKELPVEDFYSKGVTVRKDGRVMRDFYLFQVKSASESKGKWDLYSLLAKVPGKDAYRSVEDGGCSLAK
ncbi:MAG: ABC transporter substrate-binding protein [Alcaligenaceae bacterium]|nr:MAG: ABC transporter substrate-binding protein [Alcaligenaceae bacterium]